MFIKDVENLEISDLGLKSSTIRYLNTLRIFSLKELIKNIREEKLNFCCFFSRKDIDFISETLIDMGVILPCLVKSKNLASLFEKIDYVEDLEEFTENYLIYIYKLNNDDVNFLYSILNRFELKFKSKDLIHLGLEPIIAHTLYKNNVMTKDELEKLDKKDKIRTIPRIGKKSYIQILKFLEI